MTRINIAEVRASLSPIAVLDHSGRHYRVAGRELRLNSCLDGVEHGRDSVSVNREHGAWTDHACGTSGDLIDLLARLAGLDARRDFAQLLALAADIIAGTTSSPPPFAAQQLGPTSDAFAERFAQLDRRSVAGETYLARRSINALPLVARGLLRFSDRGEPAVALRSLVDGSIVGIQRRTIDGSDPKVRVDRGSKVSGSALGTSALDIAPGAHIVLVEGLADMLVASLAWPDALIFGAPGASNLKRIAIRIAPLILAGRGSLHMCVDDDEIGVRSAAGAIVAARAAGLALGRNLFVVEFEHHDLADAWAAGWRPSQVSK